MGRLFAAYLVFDATVFTFGVLSDGHNVDVIVKGLVAFHRAAGTNVGVQREDSIEIKV